MLPKSRTEGLHVSETPEGLRVVDAARNTTHTLGPVAAAVFRHADGGTPVAALAARAAEALSAPVDETAVWAVIDELTDAGLLEGRVAPPAGARRVGRREVIARMALGTAAAGAVVAVTADSAFAAPSQEQGAKLAARQEQDAKQAAARQEQLQKRQARAEQDNKIASAQRQEQQQKRQARQQEERNKRAQERSDKRLQRRGGDPIELQNGWDNVGDPYLRASVARFGRLVVLGGVVSGEQAWDTLVGVLPENCRPTGQLVFLQYGQTLVPQGESSRSSSEAPGDTAGAEGHVRVDITALGEIFVVPSIADVVSLSGITFIADVANDDDEQNGGGSDAQAAEQAQKASVAAEQAQKASAAEQAQKIG